MNIFMYNQVQDGHLVYLRDDKGWLEPALVFEYHARGESELVKGIAQLSTGAFMELRSRNTKAAWRKDVILKPDKNSKYDPEYKWARGIGFDGLHTSHLVPCITSIQLERIKTPTTETFLQTKNPFLGKLEANTKDYPSTLTATTKLLKRKQFIIDRSIKNKEFSAEIPDLTKYIQSAMLKKSEGVWVNPIVSKAALKHFGIPKSFLDASVNRGVPEYNQCIIQVDGTDTARTLGMHKDRDGSDCQVNTILGCIGASSKGGGKEVIIWCIDSLADMPRWWRTEGLSRQSFLLAKHQCKHIKKIRDSAALLTLQVGDYIFMPKGFWHWVCPSHNTDWTVMITSSIY